MQADMTHTALRVINRTEFIPDSQRDTVEPLLRVPRRVYMARVLRWNKRRLPQVLSAFAQLQSLRLCSRSDPFELSRSCCGTCGAISHVGTRWSNLLYNLKDTKK